MTSLAAAFASVWIALACYVALLRRNQRRLTASLHELTGRKSNTSQMKAARDKKAA